MHKKIWYAPNRTEAYGKKEIDAVVDALEIGWLAGNGPKTQQFEENVARVFGKQYGVFVNSGSSANLLALLVLNLPPGSEIITPACTFSTTVAPIIQTFNKPVFIDVELDKYISTVKQVVDAITPNTRAIMLPNLIGNKPEWERIREIVDKLPYKVWLIEDSCDTITHTSCTDISTTSFYASHLITAGGSGGMVMFNSYSQVKNALMYRDWGRIGDNSEDLSSRFEHNIDGISYDWKFLYGVVGYNFKSSELNAAFGLVQLKKLDAFKQHRRSLFNRYKSNLSGTPFVLPSEYSECSWLAFPLQVSGNIKRSEVLCQLENSNIQTRVCFAGNITRHPAYRQYLREDFTNSDIIMAKAFLVGCHHGMTLEDVDYVCDILKRMVV